LSLTPTIAVANYVHISSGTYGTIPGTYYLASDMPRRAAYRAYLRREERFLGTGLRCARAAQ
jgi:hypothetical protein